MIYDIHTSIGVHIISCIPLLLVKFMHGWIDLRWDISQPRWDLIHDWFSWSLSFVLLAVSTHQYTYLPARLPAWLLTYKLKLDRQIDGSWTLTATHTWNRLQTGVDSRDTDSQSTVSQPGPTQGMKNRLHTDENFDLEGSPQMKVCWNAQLLSFFFLFFSFLFFFFLNFYLYLLMVFLLFV